MKTLAAAISIFIATITGISAQDLTPCNLHVGMSLSMANTGSGHGTFYSTSINITNGITAMEAGAIFDLQNSVAKGIDFKFKNALGRYNYYYNNTEVQPFLAYNFIYQHEPSFNNNPGQLNGQYAEVQTLGRVASMEHYAALGAKVTFTNHIYVEGMAGFGGYIGSIENSKDNNSFGIHHRNNGLTSTFRLTIGYTLF